MASRFLTWATGRMESCLLILWDKQTFEGIAGPILEHVKAEYIKDQGGKDN